MNDRRMKSRTGSRELGRIISYAWINGRLIVILAVCFSFCFSIVGCQPVPQQSPIGGESIPRLDDELSPVETQLELPTPFPTRPVYSPGEMVEYVAQTGDTIPAIAVHFNTTVEEILEANDFIPPETTTLPPGMPMQIPIYYEFFWGSPYQIIPDNLFINGPSQIGFETEDFVTGQPGWLREYTEYAAGKNRTGAQIVDYVAQNFSLSPQILLALLDFQVHALSTGEFPSTVDDRYILGYEDLLHKGLYLQLVLAADLLNDGFYRWRNGKLGSMEFTDGSIENIDPWQNAATASLMNYFALNLPKEKYMQAIGQDGIARNFATLFGDPWFDVQPHLPGSLQQPDMNLPFEGGKTWAYTGGPHTGWGTGEPFAAVDFAPPAVIGGCIPSGEWNTAVANGVVARVDEGVLELDLDGDGDVRTGWVVLYLHVATKDRAPVGENLVAGQPLGHPSCEGGTSTGTHIHIARKYNGEWIPAGGILPFNLEGWVVHEGGEIYQGTLTLFSQEIVASPNAVKDNYITSKIINE